ncbi:MAG: hypothetical protein ACRD0K_09440 [Egibacteraceae bacterium]
MNQRTKGVLALFTALIALSAMGATGAWARNDSGRAASYINPDTGLATANPDVDPDSSCAKPDQSDRQRFSDAGAVNRNVHNDACFLDDKGMKLDGPASFDSSGVGLISACPDPDGPNGPEVAMLSDRDGDGRADLCFQSAFQQTGMPGDMEFHARLNNTGTAGRQTVVWCADPDRNGCADERNVSTITIDWSADG